MKYRLSCLLIVFGMMGPIPPVYAIADNAESEKSSFSNYRLGVGDKLKIQVYGEQDLELESQLTDAGTITYPLLGEIKALGLTIGELSALITEGLEGRYLVDPKVTINIIEYRDFYINGEVQKPGAYPYVPGLTVHKAVSIAGGFTERASRTSITVVDDKDPSQDPQDVELNTPVNPGDIINVEESFF
jgi:protein involved in polysaccharide export with SLBB domain